MLCLLLLGALGASHGLDLWPYPQQVETGSNTLLVLPHEFQIVLHMEERFSAEERDLLDHAFTRYRAMMFPRSVALAKFTNMT